MNKKALAGGFVLTVIISGVYYLTNRSNVDADSNQINAKDNRSNQIDDKFRDGDLIFQTSRSAQSRPIQIATKSVYSHCGIIFFQNDECYVLEAVQPVRYTKLDRWIMRGENQKYVVKRLIHADSILTNTKVEDMKRLGKEFKGKDYDLTFEWSDDKIYCSELIWKIYKRGLDIELTQLETLNDFDLSNAEVKTKLRERYGDQIPLNEPVISPKSLFESPLLKTIKEK